MLDPVPLYKDGDMRKIPAIDAQAWMSAGWSMEIAPLRTETSSLERLDLKPELPPSPEEETKQPKRQKDKDADHTAGNAI